MRFLIAANVFFSGVVAQAGSPCAAFNVVDLVDRLISPTSAPVAAGINANQTSNTDLWWALKGSSSNFGIVTRFDMETVPVLDLGI
ncbi:hypothetical protein F4802DRAFT_601370 [Xylaria palmicola]|nr:hypothetical protein F4802DRAFT_601370 [Xylaria palmicola]